MQLPDHVVTEDRTLTSRVASASEQLARLRWHWTLDESNPGRVSIRAYARQMGVAPSVIGRYAHGYQNWQGGLPEETTLSEAINRARMGAETEAATDAVAKSRGLTLTTVHNHRQPEVRRVRQIARERAEQQGTTVEEEAPKVAKNIVKLEQVDMKRKTERVHRLGEYVEMERLLEAAKRHLLRAVQMAHTVDWDEEQSELLKQTVRNLKALLDLLDRAYYGAADVDWDAELAELTS